MFAGQAPTCPGTQILEDLLPLLARQPDNFGRNDRSCRWRGSRRDREGWWWRLGWLVAGRRGRERWNSRPRWPDVYARIAFRARNRPILTLLGLGRTKRPPGLSLAQSSPWGRQRAEGRNAGRNPPRALPTPHSMRLSELR